MIKKKIFSFYQSFYVLFVDYVFSIFNSSADFQLLRNVLNIQHSNLRFKCEEVSSPSLPFLDVEVAICNGKFCISVYPQPTFTGVLLHFNSIAPLSWKRGLITCLLPCAYLYSSNYSLLKTETIFI